MSTGFTFQMDKVWWFWTYYSNNLNVYNFQGFYHSKRVGEVEMLLDKTKLIISFFRKNMSINHHKNEKTYIESIKNGENATIFLRI